MKVIHKTVIGHGMLISLPNNFTIIKVALQNNIPTIWYMFDTKEINKCQLYIEMIGTGEGMSDSIGTYIDTFFEGVYCWHVFGRIL